MILGAFVRKIICRIIREKAKLCGMGELIEILKINRSTLYRFLRNECISIKNLKKLLEGLNIKLNIDKIPVVIVAGNKIIRRDPEKLKQLIKSIISKKGSEEKLHWFNAPNLLLKISKSLWKNLNEIIEISYGSIGALCKRNGISNHSLENWYRKRVPFMRTNTLKKILQSLSITPELVREDYILPVNVNGHPLKRFLSTFTTLTNNLEKIIPKFNEEKVYKNAIDEHFAEEIGIHMGDGMMNIYVDKRGKRRFLIKISGDPIEDKIYYDFWVGPLIRTIYRKKIYPKLIKQNEYGIIFCFKKALEFKQKLGLPLGKKENMKIPNVIKEDKELLKFFIRGVFDTDGSLTFGKDKNDIPSIPILSLSSPDGIFVADLKDALDKLHLPNRKTVANGRIHTIYIQGKNLEKFMKKVGLKNLRHLSKWIIYCHYGYCPLKIDLIKRLLIILGKINPATLLTSI